MIRHIFIVLLFLLNGLTYPQSNIFRCYYPPDFVSPFVQEMNARMNNLNDGSIQINQVIIVAKDYDSDPTLDPLFDDVMAKLSLFFSHSTLGKYNFTPIVLKDDGVRAYIMPTPYTPFGDGCQENGHVHKKSNIINVLQQADIDHDFSQWAVNGQVKVHFVSIGGGSGGIANCSITYASNDGVTVIVDCQSRGINEKILFNVFCHESGHYYFQLNDLDHSMDYYDHWGLGSFDVMSCLGFENLPSLYNPVSRADKSWFTPTSITSSQTNVSIEDFQKSLTNNAYSYNVSNNIPNNTFIMGNQTFFITYHNPFDNYFYSTWPFKDFDKGGVLIWHNTQDGGIQNWKCIPVDIECAHGKYNWSITQSPPVATNSGEKNPYYGRDSLEVRIINSSGNIIGGPYFNNNKGIGSSSIFYNPDDNCEFSSSSNPNSYAHIGNNPAFFKSPYSQTASTGFKVGNIRFVSTSPKKVLVDFTLGDNTIKENTTFYDYDYYMYHDLIINSGVTLTIKPGARLYFYSGKQLVVYGNLRVEGTADNIVTFTKIGNSSNWVGIRFNNGSSGSINYAKIENSNWGIFFNNLGYNSIQVSNSIIQNNSSYGIWCVNSSLMTFQNNQILNNGSYGIYCDNYSSPYIYYNTIKGHNIAGIYSAYYSQPRASTTGGAGSNVIKDNNGCGIYANYNSIPHFGDGTAYAYNSIYNNNSYEVKSENNSTVWVQNNYWGSGYTFSGSNINYLPILVSDPNSGRTRIVEGNNNNMHSDIANLSLNTVNSIDISVSTEDDGENELSKYKDKFKKEGNTPEGRYALIKIEEYYSKLNQLGFEDFVNQEIFSRKGVKDELMVMGYELINHSLLNKQDYNGVIKNLEKIKNELLLNEVIEKNTLYSLFSIYLHVKNDTTHALKYYKELEQKFSDDILVYNSELMLGHNPGRNFQMPKGIGEYTYNSDEEYLFNSNNYPNPFNPTTTISYSLPEAGNVQIKIFDVLGREVANLVDETKNEGTHSVIWNGSNFSSGIYFYTITYQNQTLFKKMLMIK